MGFGEGLAKWTPGENEPESQETIIFEFLASRKINILTNSGYDMKFNTWEQDGDVVRIYETKKELAYHEFKQEGDKIIFIKMAGSDEEDNWSKVYAGEDFLKVNILL